MEETTCVEMVKKTSLAMHMSGLSVGYILRESTRAKRVIIKVWPSNQVEVVVPKGFNLSRLPDILKHQSEWILIRCGRARANLQCHNVNFVY